MKKFWKIKFAHEDIFTAARLKVVALYFLMGVFILGATVYLVYSHVLLIVRHVLGTASRLLTSRANINAPAAATAMSQTIAREIQSMNLAIVLWLSLVIIIAALLFAIITLWPIRRAMEKQRRLIGNVSHELNTPLSVMKANAEVTLMDGSALTQEELTAALSANLEEIEQMSKIVQLLLSLSTLENRLKKLTMAPVDLAEVARAAEESAQPLAAEKNIALTLVIPPGMGGRGTLMAKGNRPALEEMMLYILRNAFAYISGHGSVTLRVEKVDGRIVLSVEDTGVGIAEADIAHIFEPFHQASGANSGDKETNAVLGLAIAKEIAVAHHATISVVSEVGNGTRFAVSLKAER